MFLSISAEKWINIKSTFYFLFYVKREEKFGGFEPKLLFLFKCCHGTAFPIKIEGHKSNLVVFNLVQRKWISNIWFDIFFSTLVLLLNYSKIVCIAFFPTCELEVWVHNSMIFLPFSKHTIYFPLLNKLCSPISWGKVG